jgi:hypothetical protein
MRKPCAGNNCQRQIENHFQRRESCHDKLIWKEQAPYDSYILPNVFIAYPLSTERDNTSKEDPIQVVGRRTSWFRRGNEFRVGFGKAEVSKCANAGSLPTAAGEARDLIIFTFPSLVSLYSRPFDTSEAYQRVLPSKRA